MSNHISREAYFALQEKRTGTGRSLAEIGEAALLAAGKNAAAKAWEAERGEAKTQPAQPEAQKRYVVGIDPGVKTGFAVWNREEKQFEWVETSTFWGVYFRITESCVFKPSNTHIVIEVAHHAPTFKHLKVEGQNKDTLSKIARNVGQVTREAKLLVEGFRRLGYTVQEVKPLGKKKDANGKYSAEADRADFERLTGWTKQTSQHARDAARICFQR